MRFNRATAFPPSESVPFRPRTPALGQQPPPDAGPLRLHVFLPSEGERVGGPKGERVGGVERARREGRGNSSGGGGGGMGARPAVVFFAEGGWRTMEAQQFFPQCSRLASLGLVAVAAEYSAGSGGVRHCLGDAAAAVKALRTPPLRERYGIDAGRVAAAGASAGGHLAAAAALCPLPLEIGAAGRPDALLLLNAVLDLETDGEDCPAAQLRRLAASGPGKQPAEGAESTSLPPPALLLVGTSDPLLPSSRRFLRTAAAVRAATTPLPSSGTVAAGCRLVSYAGATHGWFDWTRDKAQCRATTAEMARFLRDLGWLATSRL